MNTSRYARLFSVLVVPFAAGLGCSVQTGDPLAEDAIDGFEEALTSDTKCNARLERYPVNAPYNNGYDANYSTFTCDGKYANSDYYTGSGPGHANGHLGNDIFASRGAKIVAARAGKVRYIRNNSVGGHNVAIMDDCGWSNYYAHLDSVDPGLKQGERVAAGTLIGKMGNTGSASSTAVHLHFSVFPGTDYNQGIDPYALLKPHLSTACSGGTSPGGCTAGGFYCGGDKVVGDPSTLYRCTGGTSGTVAEHCSYGCSVNAGQDDSCNPKPAVSCTPGGYYCGGDKVVGDSNTLYRCTGGTSGTIVEKCGNGCGVTPGQDDKCNASSGRGCTVGGYYCGGDKVDGKPNTLYRCSGGTSGTFVEECARGCAVNAGRDDSCWHI